MAHYQDYFATGEDSTVTVARLFHAVHGWNSQHSQGERIAVAFPLMREAVRDARGKLLVAPHSGTHVRLFANSPELLAEFAGTPIPARAARLGAVVRTSAQEVPSEAGAIRYVRDRLFEKGHSQGSYARRAAKRAEQAGREPTSAEKRKTASFGLNLASKSTERKFFVDIRKEPFAGPYSLGSINSYGLCGPGSSVPSF